MKIMTFNTQHCYAWEEKKIDFEVMARVIRDSGAEIVALNEMRGAGSVPEFEDQVGKLSELTGLRYSYFAKAIDVDGEDAPYGNGILSRHRILSAETVMIPDPEVRADGSRHYETRCVLKAQLECDLTVLVTHFGLNFDEQANAVDTVVKNLEDTRCILMGDFNVTPDNACLIPIRERMNDAADKIDGPILTFASYEPRKKIDYIFASRDIEIISADVPRIVASDHFPHTATVKLPD